MRSVGIYPGYSMATALEPFKANVCSRMVHDPLGKGYRSRPVFGEKRLNTWSKAALVCTMQRLKKKGALRNVFGTYLRDISNYQWRNGRN